jgi:hypothetical protein
VKDKNFLSVIPPYLYVMCTKFFFLGAKNGQMATHGIKFLANCFLFSKRIRQTSPYFGERVATSLSPGNKFNDPVPK